MLKNVIGTLCAVHGGDWFAKRGTKILNWLVIVFGLIAHSMGLMLLRITDDIITDVRWKTYGCASAIASTSMLSEIIKGMNIKDAYTIRTI